MKQQGPRPQIRRSKPYNANKDARELVKVIVEGDDHPAIKIRRGLYVIKPRKIPRINDSTNSTALSRGKRLKSKIQELMASHPEFEEAPYGRYLAFKKVK